MFIYIFNQYFPSSISDFTYSGNAEMCLTIALTHVYNVLREACNLLELFLSDHRSAGRYGVLEIKAAIISVVPIGPSLRQKRTAIYSVILLDFLQHMTRCYIKRSDPVRSALQSLAPLKNMVFDVVWKFCSLDRFIRILIHVIARGFPKNRLVWSSFELTFLNFSLCGNFWRWRSINSRERLYINIAPEIHTAILYTIYITTFL